MSLEDELKLVQAQQKISDLMSELNETKEKVSDLITQLNEEKNKNIMLSGDVRSLQTEIKYREAKSKNIDILNDRIEYLEKERKNLEADVEKLEGKLDTKENKIELLSQDKEELLTGKNDILQTLSEKELQIQEKDQKIGELRDKFKNSSSDLLSKSMEIEKLLKKIQGLEGDKQDAAAEVEQIKKLKEQMQLLEGEIEKSRQQKENLDTISTGTGIISDIDSIIEQIKKDLPSGESTIRLVLPDVHDLNKFGITDIIKKLPNNVIVNIAAGIENPFSDTFVKEIKNSCRLTNYKDRKFIALNVDTSKFLIGVYKGDKIIGFYTDVSDLTDLFKQTIMEPFIKGRKVI